MLKKIWQNFELYTCCVLFTAMFVVLVIQVTMRYVFSMGLIWSEEFSKYCLQWLIYMSVSMAVLRGEHIRLDVSLKIWPERYRWHAILLGEVLWLLISLYVAIHGFEYVPEVFSRGQTGDGFKISLGYVYLAMPVGFSLMCIRIVGTIVDHLKQKPLAAQSVA